MPVRGISLWVLELRLVNYSPNLCQQGQILPDVGHVVMNFGLLATCGVPACLGMVPVFVVSHATPAPLVKTGSIDRVEVRQAKGGFSPWDKFAVWEFTYHPHVKLPEEACWGIAELAPGLCTAEVGKLEKGGSHKKIIQDYRVVIRDHPRHFVPLQFYIILRVLAVIVYAYLGNPYGTTLVCFLKIVIITI